MCANSAACVSPWSAGSFDQGLAKLRNHLNQLESPAGVLRALEDRLADAKRDLRRADIF